MNGARVNRETAVRRLCAFACGLDFSLAAGKSKPQFWDPLTDV